MGKEKTVRARGGIGILYKLYGGKNDQVKIIAGKKITQCFYAQRERYRCLLLKVYRGSSKKNYYHSWETNFYQLGFYYLKSNYFFRYNRRCSIIIITTLSFHVNIVFRAFWVHKMFLFINNNNTAFISCLFIYFVFYVMYVYVWVFLFFVIMVQF